MSDDAPPTDQRGPAARLGARAQALGETSTARTVRGSARRRVDRVLGAWIVIAQTGFAAGAAWLLAHLIVGQAAPFFAPVSAVLSLSLARGQPRRRAVELVIGVAVGIGVADLLVRAIGTGTLQIVAVVVLTMVAALLLGAGTLLVNQAVVSAILVMTLPLGMSASTPANRFLDALIGGVVALIVGQVLFPRDPVRSVADAARPVLDELTTAVREAGEALSTGSVETAERSLDRVRALDSEISAFYDALAVARETAWLSPPRRRARGHLRLYADAARQVDYAVRNVRVLARAVAVAVHEHGNALAELAGPVATLADAVRALSSELAEPDSDAETRRLAHLASESATAILEQRHDLRATMIVGQVRATAVDLLRGTGMDTQAARATIGPSDLR